MPNKIALITGANSGLGLATAKALAKRSFDLILLCRNEHKGQAAQRELLQMYPTLRIELVQADLGDRASLQRAAAHINARYATLDVFIANAGYTPAQLEFTPDGIEKSFYASHIGHFRLLYYITELLRKTAIQTGDVRLISLSSAAFRLGQKERFFRRLDTLSLVSAYGDDKLANLLFAQGAARHFAGTGIRAYSVHPGVVQTNFGSDYPGLVGTLFRLGGPFMRSPEVGAQTTVFLASAPLQAIGEANNGGYFVDCRPRAVSKSDVTGANAVWLWQKSLQYV